MRLDHFDYPNQGGTSLCGSAVFFIIYSEIDFMYMNKQQKYCGNMEKNWRARNST